MPLQPQITALAQAVGADVKALRTDVTALQGAAPGGGGTSGPTGAETIVLDIATPLTTALSATLPIKHVTAQQAGHTLTLPDAATGTELVLEMRRQGCFLRDSANGLLSETDARVRIVCRKFASGWVLAVSPLSTTTGGIATVAYPVNQDFFTVCRMSDAVALVSYSNGTCRVLTSNGAGGLSVGPTLLVAQGYDRILLPMSDTKAVLIWRKYGAPPQYTVLTIAGDVVTASADVGWDSDGVFDLEYTIMSPGKILVTHKFNRSGGVTEYSSSVWSFDAATNAVTVSARTVFAAGNHFSSATVTRLTGSRAMCVFTVSGHVVRGVQIDIASGTPVLVSGETNLSGQYCYSPDVVAISPTTALITYNGDTASGMVGNLVRLVNVLPAGGFTFATEPKVLHTTGRDGRFVDFSDGSVQVAYGSAARRPGVYATPVTVVGAEVQLSPAALIAPISPAGARAVKMSADAMLVAYKGTSEANYQFANFVGGC